MNILLVLKEQQYVFEMELQKNAEVLYSSKISLQNKNVLQGFKLISF